MAKAHAEWKVLRHGPIEKLEPNLWRVTGTLQGMALKRVMTLVRMEDGRIVIHSAVALDEASMAEIEGWGRPAVLLVPNVYHRLDAPAYKARFPDLQVLCPRGGRPKVDEVVATDGDYDDFEGDSTVALQYLEGVRRSEGLLIIRSPSGATLVFNDAVFNMPHGKGVPGLIFRYITASTGGPKVTRLYRTLAIKDKEAFRTNLEELSETPDLTRIIVSHHRMITDRPAEVLREIAAAL